MYVSVVGVPVVARLSPLACVTARGKCFARVYEIKPHGLLPKSRIFPSRPLGEGVGWLRVTHPRHRAGACTLNAVGLLLVSRAW